MSNSTSDSVDMSFAPQSFAPGYIALSYCVSLVGSLSTLELLQRRTSGRGLYNWYLLFGSALTMGGVAIWAMHYIGNRAIVLYDGQPDLQLTYNPGFTALSFFLPIIMLLLAYSLAGSGEDVSKLRVGCGGVFAGLSICGMHYVGQSGIFEDYQAVYNVGHVIGSVVIAIVATTAALSIFFILRNKFKNSWWKRMIIAGVMGGAVSGMHWTAATGTKYRRLGGTPPMKALSREGIVATTIATAIVSCILLLVLAIIAGRNRTLNRNRAQKIVLTLVTFDPEGKLMVLPDGTLPSRTIMDTFRERSFEESIEKTQDIFHWIYRTSRNWKGVAELVPGMRAHLRASPPLDRRSMECTKQDSIFKEQFCIAAAELADATHQSLEKIGVLYDDMLTTGSLPRRIVSRSKRDLLARSHTITSDDKLNLGKDAEKALDERNGNGKVLFLVNHVMNRTEVTRLTSYGFRFTDPANVYTVLSQTMQVPKEIISSAVIDMRGYTPGSPDLLLPGVHLGCFAIRPNPNKGGFNVLVRQDARNLLPTIPLGLKELSINQMHFLQKYHGQLVRSILKTLENNPADAATSSGTTTDFVLTFYDALMTLADQIEDPFFIDTATLVAKPLRLPSGNSVVDRSSEDASATPAILIAFKAIVPVHLRMLSSSKLLFSPFRFFAMQQRCHPSAIDHVSHARMAHREFSGRMANIPPNSRGTRMSIARVWTSRRKTPKDGQSSKISLCSSENNLVHEDGYTHTGGIMVSQSVSVDVEQSKTVELKELGPSAAVVKLDDDIEEMTWADQLFEISWGQNRGSDNDGLKDGLEYANTT